MTEATSAVVKANKEGAGAEIDSEIQISERTGGVQLTTLPEIHRYAQWVIESKMAPPCYEKPGQIVVAIQTGAETGLTPMASVRMIYVVPGSGMPSWRTEAIRALIRRGFQNQWTGKITTVLMAGTDLVEGVFHDHPETGLKKDCKDTCYGWARTFPKARDGEMAETRYSVGHAKQAELWNSKRPGWQKNPDRMLTHRAGAFHGRDFYGGILMGLMSQEEAEEVSASSVPRIRGGVIDAGDTQGKGDPLFAPQEPIVEAETVVQCNHPLIDGETAVGRFNRLSACENCRGIGDPHCDHIPETPPVTEPPKEDSAGPLFDQDALEKRDALAETQQGRDNLVPEDDFCATHLDNPRDDCDMCNSIRMDAETQMSDDMKQKVLDRLTKADES